ncbi:MAG: hypothetical protein D6767_09130, partial [Candidatus Hydrogenedentota bacterium]
LEVQEKNLEIIGKNTKIQADIQLKALAQAERLRELELKKYEMEHESNEKKYRFLRNIGYLGIILLFTITFFGCFLILDGKEEIGKAILTHTFTTILGAFAGWGISKSKSTIKK